MALPAEHRVRVRYAETDQMGVVYHANYLVYMEEARTRFLEGVGFRYADLERRGFGLAVRKAELRYRAPAVYDDELLIHTTVRRVGGASVVFDYRILRAADEALLVEGNVELACLDLGAESPRPTFMPEEVRLALEARLAE